MRLSGLLLQSHDFLAVISSDVASMSDVWLSVTPKTSAFELDTAGEKIECWWLLQGRKEGAQVQAKPAI